MIKVRVRRVRTDYVSDYGLSEKSVTSQMTDYAAHISVLPFFNNSIGFGLVVADAL